MAIQPVPDVVLASEFPTNADRVAGIWNAKANDWAGSENAMVTRAREIALVTHNNATEALGSALAADTSRQQAQQARDDAQTAADDAGDSAAVVGRWDRLVLGPKSTPPTVDNDGQPLLEGAEYYNTTTKARYSWTGSAWMVGTNVTAGVSSVNGKAGVVNLGIADVVAPGDIVAYGPTKPAARAAIDAGYDYPRGTLTLTTSQTINRDATFGDATYVHVRLRSGGSSGGAACAASGGTGDRAGGEGGECVELLLRVADLPALIPVVIGSGGAAVTATGTGANVLLSGNPGGDSTFAGWRALGGVISLIGGNTGPSKILLNGKNGGDGAGNVGAANDMNGRLRAGEGGSSVHGGGGGGGSAYPTPGTSQTAGRGGLGKITSTSGDKAEDGQYPSGGGAGIRFNGTTGTVTSGAGAPGNCELSWW